MAPLHRCDEDGANETGGGIRKFDPKIKIVFLTMHTELAYVQEAFDAGASGYVIKHSASIDLQLAIRRALLGSTYITPGVAENGVDALWLAMENVSTPMTISPACCRVVAMGV